MDQYGFGRFCYVQTEGELDGRAFSDEMLDHKTYIKLKHVIKPTCSNTKQGKSGPVHINPVSFTDHSPVIIIHLLSIYQYDAWCYFKMYHSYRTFSPKHNRQKGFYAFWIVFRKYFKWFFILGFGILSRIFYNSLKKISGFMIMGQTEW